MKIIFYLSIWFGFIQLAFCQEMYQLVQPKFDQIFYTDFSNMYNINISNCDCRNITIEIDNGTFHKSNQQCLFAVFPKEVGLINVSIFIKKKLHKVKTYTVLRVPKFNAVLESEIYPKSYDIEYFQNAFMLSLNTFPWDINMTYNMSYDLLIVRGDNVIFKYFHNDRYFNSDIKEAFKRLERKDVIVFKNINFWSSEDFNDSLDGLIFEVK